MPLRSAGNRDAMSIEERTFQLNWSLSLYDSADTDVVVMDQLSLLSEVGIAGVVRLGQFDVTATPGTIASHSAGTGNRAILIGR
jgi:hypothetical protein